jgi:hypothetical protein
LTWGRTNQAFGLAAGATYQFIQMFPSASSGVASAAGCSGDDDHVKETCTWIQCSSKDYISKCEFLLLESANQFVSLTLSLLGTFQALISLVKLPQSSDPPALAHPDAH